MTQPQKDYTALTIDLLSAFVANNSVRAEDLPGLISSTHAALARLKDPSHFTHAVAIEDSLASPSYIISMIDGKRYRSLKRHISAKGLTPEQYRKLYNLPGDYPMVAPEYSEARRALAKRYGLGGKQKRGPAKAVAVLTG